MKQQHDIDIRNRKDDSQHLGSRRVLYTIATILLLIVNIVLPFASYYYWRGFAEFMFSWPIYIIMFPILITFLTRVIKNNSKSLTSFQRIGTIVTICLYVFPSSTIINNIDRSYRFTTREKIVNQIKSETRYSNRDTCIRMKNFPPISNCGNKIKIKYFNDGGVAVSFLKSANYSCDVVLIYTDDLAYLNDKTRFQGYVPIEGNWYKAYDIEEHRGQKNTD